MCSKTKKRNRRKRRMNLIRIEYCRRDIKNENRVIDVMHEQVLDTWRKREVMRVWLKMLIIVI